MNRFILKSTVPLFLFCFVVTHNYADTSEQAEQLNQRCAPCHGLFGQGTPGANSPRLAGLPAWYLSKATEDYKKNARKNALMVEVSGLKQMTDKEIEQLSKWLSRQAINKDPAYDIKMTQGDALAGQDKFNADCKSCHSKKGYGKKKKDAPPLASQHPAYLLASIKAFFHKDRYHDNDPIDDTFDDISDVQARDIMAWMATLDAKKQQPGFVFKPSSLPKSVANSSGYSIDSVQQTIISMPAEKNVTMHQAIAAMRARAEELGVPLVPKKIAKSTKLATVVEQSYCAPRHYSGLINALPIIANYDPCQVTLVKANNKIRLMTVNLDMLINAKQLPVKAQHTAILINQDMLAIMQAGITGKVVEKTKNTENISIPLIPKKGVTKE